MAKKASKAKRAPVAFPTFLYVVTEQDGDVTYFVHWDSADDVPAESRGRVAVYSLDRTGHIASKFEEN